MKRNKKHKAFGIVKREIAKRIRDHRRAKKSANRILRKKLVLAIRDLQALNRALAFAWNTKTCPLGRL